MYTNRVHSEVQRQASVGTALYEGPIFRVILIGVIFLSMNQLKRKEHESQ